MGKKQKKVTEQKQYVSKKANEQSENGLNMQSLLNDDMVNKLKAVANTIQQKQDEINQKQAEEEAAARQAEQKRLENDFAYLLANSDPKSHKYK
jgi:hypothetical protein